MVDIQKYPLAQVLEVKIRRVEEAERILKQKLEILEKEKEKLVEREKVRDKAVQHMKDKLFQLRSEMDHDANVPKIQQMKTYLKICQERVQQEQKKVDEQIKQVEKAQDEVNKQRDEVNRKRLEVDKLETHRREWFQEVMKEEEIELGKEMDEIGNVTFLSRTRAQQ